VRCRTAGRVTLRLRRTGSHAHGRPGKGAVASGAETREQSQMSVICFASSHAAALAQAP
jgi:hypothetical protein